MHSEHQGPAGQDGPLLRFSWSVPSWHSKDHPSWSWGFQHGSPLSTLRRLLTTPDLPVYGFSLAPVQQKQQERLIPLHQPSIPSGFTIPFFEPRHIYLWRCIGYWICPATMSEPISHKRTEGVMVDLILAIKVELPFAFSRCDSHEWIKHYLKSLMFCE